MTTVTAKYQITIPPAVRKELGIVSGSQVEIAKRGKDFVLLVNPIDHLRKTGAGNLKVQKPSMNI